MTNISQQSSEIRGLCLMKLSSEMLQNLSYFWNNKNQIGFFHFSFQVTLDLLQCSVDIDRNIQCIKFKVARNEIRKKNYYLCFLITKNNIANIEAFFLDIFIKHKP